MDSAVGRLRHTLALSLVSFVFLLTILESRSALAETLTVTIGQVNPVGTTQQISCTENKRCELPFDIQTAQGSKETITAYLSFSLQGTMLLEFKAPQGYLYSGDRQPADPKSAIYEVIWHQLFAKGTTKTFNTTLFLPAVPNSTMAQILMATPQNPVADLQITAEAAP